MMRNILEPGGAGFPRRMPIIGHLLFVGASLSIIQIVGDQFKELILSFNESATLSWNSLLTAIVLLGGYLYTLVFLASTKILVEWLVDGK